MKRFVVAIAVVNGKTICNPPRVDVGPGDTIRWTCEDGDLVVDFQHETAFTSTQTWNAGRDQMTPAAVVKTGLRSGTIFRPKVSINGAEAPGPPGDVIVR